MLAAVVAVGFLVGAVYFTIHAEAIQRVATGGLDSAALFAVIGFALALIAVLVLTRRPYRPDLGDTAFADQSLRWLYGLPRDWHQSKRQTAEPSRRSWWTGEIKKHD